MKNLFNEFNTGKSDFVTPGMQLAYVSEAMPDETAIIYIDRECKETRITWLELHKRSNKLARLLLSQGIGPGTNVIVTFPNTIDHIVAVFAIWKTGACYVPISSKTPASETEEICRHVRPGTVFSDFIPSRHCHWINSDAISELIEGHSDEMPPDTPACPNKITLSGGTSGALKLLMQNMPAGNSEDAMRFWSKISGQKPRQRFLLTGALYHGAPQTSAFNGLFAGSTLVMLQSVHPESILRCIREYQIKYVQMVPTLMYRILRQEGLRREDLATLEALYHTGGYCSPYLKQKWLDLLAPEKIYELYSMSEAIGMTSIRGDEWLLHRGSVGRCVTGDISIRDEEGNELPPFKIGEIFMSTRGNDLDVKYVNREQLEVLPGGFRSVGDLGYVDDEGYLYFVDRRGDMIVTGGENVYASEVENVLIMNENIMDAMVIGIPDEEWGRRLHAVVEARRGLSEDTLRDFLLEFLPNYKIPKSFEFVSEIPRKENGKADRAAIMAKFSDVGN